MSTRQNGIFFKMKGLISLVVLLIGAICLGGTGIALADPVHCDRDGYPSCYSVGYNDGWKQGIWYKSSQQYYDPSCPSGHSENFCTGYRDGYNQGWNSNSEMNSNTIGQSQSSGVDIHGNNNRVTVNQGQSGQIGSG